MSACKAENNTAFKTGIFSCLLLCLVSHSFGHKCPDRDITYDTLAAGVIEEKVCMQYNICVRDTFYQDSLLHQLVQKWDEATYVSIGITDSIQTTFFYDTIPEDTINILIPYQREKLWGKHTLFLKNDLEPKDFFYEDTRVNFSNDTLTFAPLLLNPYLAFFNEYDSIAKLGMSPTIDCMFESEGFFFTDSGIIKTGKPETRIAGVSVLMEEFCAAVNIPPGECPEKRNKLFFIRHKDQMWALPGNPYSPRDQVSLKIYTLTGKLLGSSQFSRFRLENDLPAVAPGNYFLKAEDNSRIIGSR